MRDLTPGEFRFVALMFAAAKLPQLSLGTRVEWMEDGGMGSLRFEGSNGHLGAPVAEAEFVDKDGIPVSVTLNADTAGRPFELDIWKVDFSPLSDWPEPADVTIKAKGALQ